MGIFEIMAIGAGLSIDAVCVAVTNGMGVTEKKGKLALLTALFFGFFQGMMPILGYYAGSLFSEAVSHYSQLLVAVIFFFLGGKMIFEVFHEEETVLSKALPVRLLFVQAIATSMDALAVGVSFSLMNVPVLPASVIIASITFFLCLPAFWLGKKCSNLLDQKIGIVGGVILILIGLKSLLGG